METHPLSILTTSIIADETLQGLLQAEPEICLQVCRTAVAQFSTARGAAEWTARSRFSERLADIAAAAGALEDAAVRNDARLVFESLAGYAGEVMTGGNS